MSGAIEYGMSGPEIVKARCDNQTVFLQWVHREEKLVIDSFTGPHSNYRISTVIWGYEVSNLGPDDFFSQVENHIRGIAKVKNAFKTAELSERMNGAASDLVGEQLRAGA